MNKIFKRIYLLIIFVFGMLTASSVKSFAETKEGTIKIGEGYETGAFYITWDNDSEKGTVIITAPDGTVYSMVKTPDNVYESEGVAMVGVPKVPAGEWKVKVIGNNLGTIHVEFGRIPGAMNIDSFSVTVNGNKGIAKLAVSDSEPEVQIEIFVDEDTVGFDGERVFSTYGAPNGSFEFDLSNYRSGEYHFYVVVSKDGTWSREYYIENISYHNPSATNRIHAVGGNYNGDYYLRWDFDPDMNRYYTVYIWDENMELLDKKELEDENYYSGSFSDDNKKVFLAVVYSNTMCDYDIIEVSKDASVDATVNYDVEGNITNRSFINANVSFSGNKQINCYLNGKHLLESAEQGLYRIDLAEGNNSVTFEITDENGNMEDFVKELILDTYPPQLAISENINGVKTAEDYIYVSGYSETGAKLLLNGNPVTMEQGYFNEKISLSDGENEINLTATDAAGNVSSYKAIVIKNDVKEKKEIKSWIIAGVVFVVLLGIYIFLFLRARKEDRK